MEQRQTIGTKEGATPGGAPSASDLFVFRPSVAAHTPPYAPRPSPKSVADALSVLQFRFVHPPGLEGRPNPQDSLLEQDAAYFRRLLTQYWTFPTNEEDPAACIHFNLPAISIIYDLIAKSERQRLTYGDLHQLEMAMVRVMPEVVLRSEACLLRAHYRVMAPPALLRQYAYSKITPVDDAADPVEALRAEMAMLLSQIQHYWARGDVQAEARAAAWQVFTCWTLGISVLGAIGFVLTRLLPVPPSVAPAVPLLMALLGGGAAAFAYIRREHP